MQCPMLPSWPWGVAGTLGSSCAPWGLCSHSGWALEVAPHPSWPGSAPWVRGLGAVPVGWRVWPLGQLPAEDQWPGALPLPCPMFRRHRPMGAPESGCPPPKFTF